MSPEGNTNTVLSKLLKSSAIVAKESIEVPTVDKDNKMVYESMDVTIKPLNNRRANDIYSNHENNTQRISYEIIITSIEELKDLKYEQFKHLGFGTTSQLSGRVLEVSGLQNTELSKQIKSF